VQRRFEFEGHLKVIWHALVRFETRQVTFWVSFSRQATHALYARHVAAVDQRLDLVCRCIVCHCLVCHCIVCHCLVPASRQTNSTSCRGCAHIFTLSLSATIDALPWHSKNAPIVTSLLRSCWTEFIERRCRGQFYDSTKQRARLEVWRSFVTRVNEYTCDVSLQDCSQEKSDSISFGTSLFLVSSDAAFSYRKTIN
jgi:hypothetical protein